MNCTDPAGTNAPPDTSLDEPQDDFHDEPHDDPIGDVDDDAACEVSHHHAEPIHLDARALEAAAAFFRAAGDVARLSLLVRLRRRPLCVGELAEATGEGMSTVSQRLRVLRTEGLLVRKREGRHVRYALADAHVADLVDTALAHARHHRARRAHVPPSSSETGGKP